MNSLALTKLFFCSTIGYCNHNSGYKLMEVNQKFSWHSLVYGGILILSFFCITYNQNFLIKAEAANALICPDLNQNCQSYPKILHPATKIYLENQGQNKTFVTRSGDLVEALREVGIELRSGLVTEPDRYTKLSGGELNVLLHDASIPINIADGSFYYQVNTANSTVKNILLACDIPVGPKDIVTPGLMSTATAGSTIKIQRAKSLKITYGEKSYLLETQAKKMKEAIEEAKKEFNIPEVEAKTNDDAEVMSNQEVQVAKVEKNEITETETIQPEVQYVDDWEMTEGETRVLEEGSEGERMKKILQIIENGQETGREIISEEVTRQPQVKKVAVGKKVVETPPPPPPSEPVNTQPSGPSQVGTASWYEYGSTPTCAHRDYPHGTQLLVTNNNNGSSIVVTVNDYGPAAWTGRVIDLNSVAFSAIAPLSQGLTEVTVTPL